jgi:hypothetical protein
MTNSGWGGERSTSDWRRSIWLNFIKRVSGSSASHGELHDDMIAYSEHFSPKPITVEECRAAENKRKLESAVDKLTNRTTELAAETRRRSRD